MREHVWPQRTSVDLGTLAGDRAAACEVSERLLVARWREALADNAAAFLARPECAALALYPGRGDRIGQGPGPVVWHRDVLRRLLRASPEFGVSSSCHDAQLIRLLICSGLAMVNALHYPLAGANQIERCSAPDAVLHGVCLLNQPFEDYALVAAVRR